MRRLAHILLACAIAAPVQALDLRLPAAAQLTFEETEAMGRYEMPIGPWSAARFDRLSAEGSVTRLVWQISPYSGTSAQLMAELRAQLVTDGYDVQFSCADRDCGGFDFRFGIDVVPEPAMHVNLGDFAYLFADRTMEDSPDRLALLISRGGGNAFIHLVHAGPPGETLPDVTQSTRAPGDIQTVFDSTDLIATLEATGMVTLDDLQFQTGASALSGDDYASLVTLAAYLNTNPDRQVVLVGHTDAEGALENNIALSRSRAGAVRDFLIANFDVSGDQLRAEGVGYLSPRAPNSTDDGRELNRRVEVVLTSTD